MGNNKSLMFGLIGGFGCLVGALIGELFLVAGPTEKTNSKAVTILLDVSGSMAGGKLQEVKIAANSYVAEQDLENNKIGVIGFGSNARVATELTRNKSKIQNSISELYAHGGTNMTSGLNASRSQLDGGLDSRYILIFTDGMPNSESRALREAKQARQDEITIVAIATADAQQRYLEKLTGDPDLVISATAGNFSESFEKADKIISGLIGKETGFLGIAGWTALISLGVSIALVVGQNLYSKRPFLNKNEALVASCGGLFAGAVAGIVGQAIFLPFQGIAGLQFFGTLVGWAILGSLVGRGMAFFVPNLDATKSLAGGAIAGAIAAIGFMFASSVLADFAGRLLGAAILGFILGLLIALVEMAFRDAWLEVGKGREKFNVNLGSQPVSIGSARKCNVYVAGANGEVCRYFLSDSKVTRFDCSSENSQIVKAGHSEMIEGTKVTVCSGDTSPTKSQGGAPPPPPPPPPPGKKAISKPVAQRPGLDVKKDSVPTVRPPPPPAPKKQS